jgi:hypothetical protein
MSRPMLIEFAVGVPGAAAGREVAQFAEQMGYVTKVVFDAGEDDGPSWTCYCTKSMLDLLNVVAAQVELHEIGREFGGECDHGRSAMRVRSNSRSSGRVGRQRSASWSPMVARRSAQIR